MKTDLKFEIVCEGSSDLAVIEEIILNVSKTLNRSFKVNRLRPRVDATGKYERYGYSNVKSWCDYHKNQLEKHNVDKIGAMLTLAKSDYLLIQIDGDVADKIEINDCKYNPTEKKRRDWCSDCMDVWLGMAKIKNAGKIRYVIPTYQIETWILATYDETTSPSVFPDHIADYETISDVETKLISLGYEVREKKPTRIYKEYKMFKNNEAYIPRILNNLDTVQQRCAELKNFINFLNTPSPPVKQK